MASVAMFGCEEEPAPPAAEPIAAVPMPPPAPPSVPAAPAEPTRPVEIDTELTDARRAAIEKDVAEAKGFVVATEIESDLKEDKAVSEEKAALAAFDKAAKGKWVLFTGPMVNLTDDGFDIGITYTPLAPNDRMGMSRQFFTVTLSEVEGYEKGDFEAGDKVVVLAKYTGNKIAKPGYELVEKGVWK
jgi:hypothetical protein